MTANDLQFQYVAGVYEIPTAAGLSTAPVGSHRRDLFNHGERSWDVLPENDHPDSRDQWRHSRESVNQRLVDHLRDLQDRSTDESIRNPIVEGVITKQMNDILGEDGPTLQIEYDDWEGEEYANAAEKLVKEVFQAVTADGEETLADWLAVGLANDWTKGGSFDQFVYDADVDHPIKTRLFPIEIERLETPPSLISDDSTLLGITRNKFGRPVTYWVSEERDLFRGYAFRHTPVDARFGLHCYHRRYTGQVRGIPRLASALAAIAELRQYDQAVMDVAQTAAMLGVLVYTTSELVEPPTDMATELNKSVQLKRRGITRLPYHHQAEMLNSNQPPPQYKEFRHERSRDVGRPMGMPQLAVQMDASGHNFSSARLDERGYERANKRLKKHWEHKRLNPYVRRVLREAEGLRLLPRRRGSIRFHWQWPPSESIDPVKEAMAQKLRLANYSASPIGIAREEGRDFDQLCKEWAKAIEIMKENKLPLSVAGIPLDPALLAAEMMGTPAQ